MLAKIKALQTGTSLVEIVVAASFGAALLAVVLSTVAGKVAV